MNEFENFKKNERSSREQDNPKGHPPIKYVDGKYVCPERGDVSPHFEIGPEEHHRKLFIEYERTFGRGEAKRLTHGPAPYIPGDKSEEEFNEKYGLGLREQYQEFSNKIRVFLLSGSREECEEMITQLRKYRGKHSAMYNDVQDPNAKKKKFEIHPEK